MEEASRKLASWLWMFCLAFYLCYGFLMMQIANPPISAFAFGALFPDHPCDCHRRAALSWREEKDAATHRACHGRHDDFFDRQFLGHDGITGRKSHDGARDPEHQRKRFDQHYGGAADLPETKAADEIRIFLDSFSRLIL